MRTVYVIIFFLCVGPRGWASAPVELPKPDLWPEKVVSFREGSSITLIGYLEHAISKESAAKLDNVSQSGYSLFIPYKYHVIKEKDSNKYLFKNRQWLGIDNFCDISTLSRYNNKYIQITGIIWNWQEGWAQIRCDTIKPVDTPTFSRIGELSLDEFLVQQVNCRYAWHYTSSSRLYPSDFPDLARINYDENKYREEASDIFNKIKYFDLYNNYQFISFIRLAINQLDKGKRGYESKYESMPNFNFFNQSTGSKLDIFAKTALLSDLKKIQSKITPAMEQKALVKHELCLEMKRLEKIENEKKEQHLAELRAQDAIRRKKEKPELRTFADGLLEQDLNFPFPDSLKTTSYAHGQDEFQRNDIEISKVFIRQALAHIIYQHHLGEPLDYVKLKTSPRLVPSNLLLRNWLNPLWLDEIGMKTLNEYCSKFIDSEILKDQTLYLMGFSFSVVNGKRIYGEKTKYIHYIN